MSLRPICLRLLIILGGLNPAESCSHAGKTPDFEKSTFSALGGLFLDFGGFLKVNQRAKISEIRFWKVMKKQVEKRDVFFRHLESQKWLWGVVRFELR